jgi:hypothetical protein
MAQNIQGRARHIQPTFIAASFNVEKLVRRIPFHFRAEQQQQQQQQHLAIPNTATTSLIHDKNNTQQQRHNNREAELGGL